MFQHGKLKEKKQPLSENEIKKIQEKISKIDQINKDILKKKNSNNTESNSEKYDVKNLEYLYKASKMISDSTTIWNYRKDIILNMKKKISEDMFYEFLKEEVQRISVLLLSNPKSYVLWNHREWILLLASEYEVKNNIYDSSLLRQDILLCNKFLIKDNRNFHCWNYRLSLVLLVNNIFANKFNDLINEEMDYVLTKIKESCSNFSAWHYRSKLVSIYFNLDKNNKINFNTKEALDYFNSTDIPLLKKAMFTDPRDQSPWNYHFWLINNLTPIIGINCECDKNKGIVKVVLSEKLLIKKLFNNEFLYKIEDKEDIIDNIVEFDYNKIINYKDKDEIDLFNKNISDNDNDLLSINNSLVKDLNIYSFNKLNLELPSITFDVNSENIIIVKNTFKEFQIEFLLDQLLFINDLIKESEGFTEYAYFRRIQIVNILLKIDNFKDFMTKYKDRYSNINISKESIDQDYDELIKNSKRQSNMYKSLKQSNI